MAIEGGDNEKRVLFFLNDLFIKTNELVELRLCKVIRLRIQPT